MNQWLRLDNAAKIFPSVSGKNRTNLFRLTAQMKEDVHPLELQEALISATKRIRSFNVRLKKGFFWYYLDPNPNHPVLYEEHPYVCRKWSQRDNQGFLFQCTYFKSRITLEVFHALTDGAGALEFLKAIVYSYLRLRRKSFPDGEYALTEVEELLEESQDSFVKNYDPSIKVKRKEDKAIKVSGSLYPNHWVSLISGIADEDQMKQVAKRHQATITEYIAAVTIFACHQAKSLFEKKDRPFKLFIPVNLRRIFPSKTLRNFSLYVRTTWDFNNPLDFESILLLVKQQMKEEVVADKLLARIVSNVKFEKNIIMRIIPLRIKKFFMKIGYNALGEKANSFSLSNIGIANIPASWNEYVDYIEFSNGASKYTQINLGVVSYNKKLVMTFTSTIKEREIQKEFFRFLAKDGIAIAIHTNELEV